jgi:hypothetical protein
MVPLMLHPLRVVAMLLVGLLATIFTADLPGGPVSNAAGEVPLCSNQLRFEGKGPEGAGYWTQFPALNECDTGARLRKANPGCVRARCVSRGQCNVCRSVLIDEWWVNWSWVYYANDSGCLRYVCTGARKHR